MKKKHTLRNILIVAGVGILLTCICLVIAVASAPSNIKSTPTAVVAAVQATQPEKAMSFTEEPTRTLETSSTLIPPANTPAPFTSTPLPATLTPTITFTLTPTVDSSGEAYIAKVTTLSTFCATSIDSFSENNTKASEDPTLIFDEDWINSTAKTLVGIKTFCVPLGEISPVPPAYMKADGYLKKAASEFSQMIDDYTKGIDQMDADKISASVKHMENATNYVVLATNALPPKK